MIGLWDIIAGKFTHIIRSPAQQCFPGELKNGLDAGYPGTASIPMWFESHTPEWLTVRFPAQEETNFLQGIFFQQYLQLKKWEDYELPPGAKLHCRRLVRGQTYGKKARMSSCCNASNNIDHVYGISPIIVPGC